MSTVENPAALAKVPRSSRHFHERLAYYRTCVLERIRELIPNNRYRRMLYEPMLEYPLREGKAFRPALCLAVCQACGGRLEEALDTAAALEMFHNAFLIHDDIEDDSKSRRGQPTLHTKYSIAIATNVGDGLGMLAMRTLLRNTRTIGLERALALLFEIERMARETTEGQSIELDWIHHKRFDVTPVDYLRMCRKKTCWYTCIAPMRAGALIAGLRQEQLLPFVGFGFKIGAAFQIQDDVLNLTSTESRYGKEIGGDIAEGKRTLSAIHLLSEARPSDRRRLREIYARPRAAKSAADIAFVSERMEHYGSVDFAATIARRLSLSAAKLFDTRFRWIGPSSHRRFLEEMIHYMIDRQF